MYNWFIRLPQSIRLLMIVILYACVFAAHVLGVNYYVKHFAERIDSVQVVVAKHAIPLHTIITEEDVKLIKVRYNSMIEGAIVDPYKVIGQESQVSLNMHEQFHADKLNEMVKQADEMIIEIPSEWVLSFPKSLRRLDRVRLLPVLDSAKSTKVYSEGDIVTGGTDPLEAEVKTTAAYESTESSDAENAAIQRANIGQKLLTGLKVAYFKDSTANEVRDAQPSQAAIGKEATPRIHTSNLGARLELAITMEQWDIMKHLIDQHYKFVISYE